MLKIYTKKKVIITLLIFVVIFALLMFGKKIDLISPTYLRVMELKPKKSPLNQRSGLLAPMHPNRNPRSTNALVYLPVSTSQ